MSWLGVLLQYYFLSFFSMKNYVYKPIVEIEKGKNRGDWKKEKEIAQKKKENMIYIYI